MKRTSAPFVGGIVAVLGLLIRPTAADAADLRGAGIARSEREGSCHVASEIVTWQVAQVQRAGQHDEPGVPAASSA
jgi:hypothetical protein